jgi:pSer/pThr/pTyr-binding forkhead associated (FHA) protein
LLAIKTDEVILGSDAREATFVVDDPSVERVHTRLIHQSDGSFRVTDQNSTAGTWVNYAPISPEGTHLEHGDLLHVGKVGFRFTYLYPNGQARRAVISPNQSNN